MPKILDRYLLREIVLPFFLWLLLLTFVLIMPPILQNAEQLIAKGVAWPIVLRVLLTLVPQALGITIPMALLLGILIGLGRLSADREFVALQACGVSIFRVMRPIVVLSPAACAATAHVMIVPLPNANQTVRTITVNVIASNAGSDIKPRVFFAQFPDRVLYVREVRATAAENAQHGAPTGSQYFTIQQKFSIPIACLVLALIGVALGVSNRKDGKLAGFVVGIGVIFVYYVLLWTSRAGAISGRLWPAFAPWIANVVLGIVGVGLVIWRAGSADQPIRISVPTFWRSRRDAPATLVDGSRSGAGTRRVVLVIRVPHMDLPRPTLLDLYVSREYLRVFVLSFVSLVGLFYISTFIDLADKLFRGTATSRMLLRYFYWQTPQYVYYIIPLAALVATLVTMGLLTKNSELIVMRACGISLYRSALPILVFAVVFSGVLFMLEEHVLANSNRQAQRLNAVIRGWPVQTFGVLDRRWIVGTGGDIYHYEIFNPAVNQFSRLSLFHVDHAAWRLDSLTYAKDVSLVRQPGDSAQPSLTWVAHQGWMRELKTARRHNRVETVVNYQAFAERPVSLEPPKF